MKVSPLIRLLLVVASCQVLTITGGCAFVDQKIGLNYARPDQSPVRHSGEISVTRAAARPSPRNGAGEWIVGSLNNVHGVHQADLLSDRSPEEWITDALLHELRQAGYTASYAESFPLAARHGLAVTGVSVFLTVNKGAVSAETRNELKFNIEVYRNGDRLKTFTVASRDDRIVPFNASKEEKERIMLQSLQDAMQSTLPEIIALIDKK
jgi:hypothetical protein